MINYSCDLCGSKCNNKVFALPIAATFIGAEPCDLIPINLNLCQVCRSDIYKTIESMVPRERIEELNKQAIDIKMNRI